MRPRIPRRLFLELTVSLVRHEPRSVMADTGRMVAALPRAPLIARMEHVPAAGGLVVVANHYQRWDLWIGWEGALLMQALGRPIHWLALRELRLGGREAPLTRRLFSRVAAIYGFIPVPADSGDHAGHAAAIRSAARLLRAGQVVGFFPEGQRGHAGGLSPAVPGAAELACLLSRFAPLVPAAVWQDGHRLVAAFGPPFRLSRPNPAALMQPIAGLLPSPLTTNL